MRPWHTRLLFMVSLVLGGIGSIALAEYCWVYVDNTSAYNPKEWYCSFNPPSGANPANVNMQNVLDEHANWHCRNGPILIDPSKTAITSFGTDVYGRAFLAMHKQMIWDFDLYREQILGLPRIEIWDVNDEENPASPNYNPMPYGIPGSNVTVAQANAIAFGAGCLAGTGRAAGVPCPTCNALYNQFRHPSVGGLLDTFATAGSLGDQLDAGWHGAFHGDIASTTDGSGNFCSDINPPSTSPRDAMFWRAHKALDEVHSEWQRLQASDIMIVLDRSGSMSAPASSGGGGTSKIDAAKSATDLFASLVENGQGHTVGLVSFSSNASSPVDLGLTSADVVEPAMMGALAPIAAGGSTSIGDGLLAAQTELATNGANARKAILLLTDGKENQPDCLDGTGVGCTGPGSDIAPNAFGDTHVCAVGYGEPSNLDSLVLRDLVERQGGIFTAFTELNLNQALQLKKFFLQCFANISDEQIASDPMQILPANQQLSDPMPVTVTTDRQLTVVLAWDNPEDPLQLMITTPSGISVDLSHPSLETSSGDTWHFVRIPLPYTGNGFGEANGVWTVQARRQSERTDTRNVFFIDALVSGPARLLPINPQLHAYTTEGLNPVVRIPESSRPLGNFERVEASVTITRPTVGIGTLVAEHGLTEERELTGDALDPVSGTLVDLSRKSGKVLKVITHNVYNDDRPARQSVQYFKRDDGNGGAETPFEGRWVNIDPTTRENTKLVIKQRPEGPVTVHAWGKCHPTDCDWGVNRGKPANGTVQVQWQESFVTRDLTLSLEPESLIPTITETYRLYDDGTHGDRFANNHYWSAYLPSLGHVEGNYQLHYVMEITHKGQTFRREADQTVYVEVKIDPDKTKVDVEDLGMTKGRHFAKLTILPMDAGGNLLGPGRQDLFEISTTGDARVDSKVGDDGSGRYHVTASWTQKQGGRPTLVLSQNGRVRLTLNLLDHRVKRGMPSPPVPHQHGGPIDPSFTKPCRQSQLMVLSDTHRIHCLDVSVERGHAHVGRLDTATNALTVAVRPVAAGSLTIDLPRSILPSSEGRHDRRFTVLLNNKPHRYTERTKHPWKHLFERVPFKNRRLTIPFAEGTAEIKIIGAATDTSIGRKRQR